MANQLARILVDGEAQDREIWQDDLLVIITDYSATFKVFEHQIGYDIFERSESPSNYTIIARWIFQRYFFESAVINTHKTARKTNSGFPRLAKSFDRDCDKHFSLH